MSESYPSFNERLSQFPNTRWTLVLAAVGEDGERAKEALEELCRRYWKPIYVFLRKTGRSSHEAEDLTQGFFQRILRDESLKQARAERGKLRSFLLGNLKRHLAADLIHRNAQKRGGGVEHVSIDISPEDTAFLEKIVGEDQDPETLYERAWAGDLFQTVLDRLASQYTGSEDSELFDLLKDSLLGERNRSYAYLAEASGMSEVALRSRVNRMRKAFRAELKREIAETVESPDQVNEEMRHLASLLRS